MNLLTLVTIGVVLLFSLPKIYEVNKKQIDAGVEQIMAHIQAQLPVYKVRNGYYNKMWIKALVCGNPAILMKAGQRPRLGTKSCRKRKFPINICPSVHLSVAGRWAWLALIPGWLSGLAGWLAGPEVWLADREAWLDDPEAWLAWPWGGRTYGWT